MTLLWMDSFAGYSASAEMLTAGYTEYGVGVVTNGGRWGTGACKYYSTLPIIRGASVGTEGVVGWCHEVIQNPGISIALWEALEGATIHLALYVNSSQQPVICRGTSANVLGTATTALTIGTPHMIQIDFKIDDSTGYVDVWIDDTKEISVSGVDTRNAGVAGSINLIRWGGGGTTAQQQMSECYILNKSGSAPNNALWGSYRIQARRPSGAGNYSQFTPLSSTNVSNVDDTQGNDGDTSYNYSTTAGNKDTFQFSAITPTSGTVNAIMHRIVARKDDAGVRIIRPKQRQSSTDYDETSANITTTYLTYSDIVVTNPATSAAYTVSEMRSTSPEFGYELVA